MEVVSTMHKNGHLPWLDDACKENRPFVFSLLNTSGLPRALEYLLEQIEIRAKAFKINLKQMKVEDIEAASNRSIQSQTQYDSCKFNVVVFLTVPRLVYSLDIILHLSNHLRFMLRHWHWEFLGSQST